MFPKKKSIIAQKITQNRTHITEYKKNFLKETLKEPADAATSEAIFVSQ